MPHGVATKMARIWCRTDPRQQGKTVTSRNVLQTDVAEFTGFYCAVLCSEPVTTRWSKVWLYKMLTYDSKLWLDEDRYPVIRATTFDEILKPSTEETMPDFRSLRNKGPNVHAVFRGWTSSIRVFSALAERLTGVWVCIPSLRMWVLSSFKSPSKTKC